MVVGNTRDLGIYKDIADFEVGVFNFPQAGVDRPALESDDLYHGVVLELGYRP